MKQYLDLMKDIRENGVYKEDRTGTGTYSVFAPQMRFNLQEGFPLVTTKRVHLKSIIHELLWFLKGETNISYLKENGVSIWDEWADENGELGPVYGSQWRSWKNITVEVEGNDLVVNTETFDQITQVVNTLKNNPDSRRIIVSAWNVADINKMKLPPCHCLFQFYTRPLTIDEREIWFFGGADYELLRQPRRISDEDMHRVLDDEGVPRRFLDCQLYQRSADFFLGVPFNIASYALLTMMLAQVSDMLPGEFVWTGGDTHLYSNHLEQADLQLTRKPHPLPKMVINPNVKDIFAFQYEDFKLENYESDAPIKAPVAV